MGRLKDIISPRLRGFRCHALSHNVCTAHHDHRKLFFGVKLFYTLLLSLEVNLRPVGGHLELQANFNLAADLRAAVKHVRATSVNRPLIEPLLQRLTDVVRA